MQCENPSLAASEVLTRTNERPQKGLGVRFSLKERFTFLCAQDKVPIIDEFAACNHFSHPINRPGF